jgi:hypothetical protein
MPSQIFKVTRAPEATPIDARDVRWLIAKARQDSEWDVKECVLQAAELVSVDVAMAEARKKKGAK